MQIKALLLFAAAAFAAPVELEERASVTCGSTTYTSSQVSSAVNAGCNGPVVNNYPHQYNNYEGFSFPDSPPYYEFPIKKSGVYTGGSPGADRIVFDGNCVYQGSITHTGASGNNFVGCSDTN